MSDLKPCPFCGGEASAFEDTSHSTAWDVGCYNGACKVEPHHWEPTKEEAAAAWNTRTDRIEELEAKLAKAVEGLMFYADKDKWIREVPYLGSEADADSGDKARATIAKLTSSEAANGEAKGGKDE